MMDDMDNMNGAMDHNMHNRKAKYCRQQIIFIAYETHGSSHFLAFNKVLPIEGFIFQKWNIKTTGDVAWTCLVIGLLAFLVEFIKVLRNILLSHKSS